MEMLLLKMENGDCRMENADCRMENVECRIMITFQELAQRHGS
jgi:hypothetical protein